MAKKGVFPILLGETHTTSAATKWGEDTSKEVGVIKIATAHNVTFDSTNYPGEPGDMVIVQNSDGNSRTVTITPDPFGDADANLVSLTVGDFVSVMYHEVHGWIFVGGVTDAGAS